MAEIGLNQKTLILTYREFQVKSNQIAQRKREPTSITVNDINDN